MVVKKEEEVEDGVVKRAQVGEEKGERRRARGGCLWWKGIHVRILGEIRPRFLELLDDIFKRIERRSRLD